jgi:hypothetical protein
MLGEMSVDTLFEFVQDHDVFQSVAQKHYCEIRLRRFLFIYHKLNIIAAFGTRPKIH